MLQGEIEKSVETAAPKRSKNSDTIKVLLVAHSTNQLGGQSVQAKGLLNNFAKSESKISASFLPNDPQYENFIRRFQKIKYVRTIFTKLKFVRNLFSEVKKHDIIQVFSASNFSYLISTLPPLFIGKIYGKKVILNYHSGEAADHFERWEKVVRPTLKMFDRIVVPSEYLVKTFADFGFKADVVPNFIDAGIFKFNFNKTGKPVILSNRNFESLYNVQGVLRAFRLIQNQFPEAELLIAGSGKQKEKLQLLAKELNLQNIEFLGAVSQGKMAELYGRSAVYLNCSNIDNMPLSIIEAFASGTPVVTTNAGGIPFMIEHEKTGILVEKEDFEALAEQTVRLLKDNKTREKLALNAEKKYLENYSWESVKNAWIKVYEKLSE